MDENKIIIEEIEMPQQQEEIIQPDQQTEENTGQEEASGVQEATAEQPLEETAPVLILPFGNKDLLDEHTHEWFKIEQKIKARTEYGAEDELYETHVRDFASDRLYLDIPKLNGAFIVSAMGTKILANFIMNNNVYFFETKLISITRLRGIAVWVVEMPTDFKRIQRRNFLRMDILLPVQVRVETKDGIFLPAVKTNCLDISGGGMRYVLDFPLNEGKMARIIVDNFPGVGSLEALCKAVRSVKSIYSDENYWIGAQFVDLPYKLEDKIVRHIFQIQKRVIVSSSSE